MRTKLLSLFLALTFAFTLVPTQLVGSVAEEIPDGIELYAEEPTEEPTAEPTVDPTEEPTAEPIVDPTEEPTAEPTVDPTEEPTAEPTVESTPEPTEDIGFNIDPNKTVAENPDFTSGYVMIIRESEMYIDAEAANVLLKVKKAQYAYAISRIDIGATRDRVQIAINTKDGIQEGYLASGDVRPLSEEEIEKYLRAAERDEKSKVYSTAILLMSETVALVTPGNGAPVLVGEDGVPLADFVPGDGTEKSYTGDTYTMTVIPGEARSIDDSQSKAAFRITSLSVNGTSASPYIGTLDKKLTFKVSMTGGTRPYILRYKLYVNGTLAQTTSWAYSTYNSSDYVNLTVNTACSIYIVAEAYDYTVARLSTATSPTCYIAKALKFTNFKPTQSVGEVDKPITFNANTTGGEAPLTYIYRVFRNGVQITQNMTQSNKTYTYTPLTEGTYYARVTVKDYRGRTIADNSTNCVVSRPLVISRVSTGITTFKVNTRATYSIGASGGKAPLKYRFIVYRDGKPVSDTGYISEHMKGITFTTVGTYYVKGVVKDANGLAKNMNSKWVTVDGPLAVTVVTTGSSTPGIGDTVTFSAKAGGGKPTYQYRFRLYRASTCLVDSGFITQSSYKYTYRNEGEKFYLRVDVKDQTGKIVNKRSGVYTVSDGVIYRAVVVGQRYRGTSSELTGTVNDARGIESVLKNFTKTSYSVTRYTDLTASGILSAISSKFANADSNDVSLFYYSGHGLLSNYYSSLGSLCGTSGYVSPAQLRSSLDQIKGNKIIIIDACHSGNMIGAGNNRETILTAKEAKAATNDFVNTFIAEFAVADKSGSNLADSGYYVICAARYDESSYETTFNGTRAGIFTMYFTKASGWDMLSNSKISMRGDRNSDNFISIDEAYQYVRKNISTDTQTAQSYPLGSSFKIGGR